MRVAVVHFSNGKSRSKLTALSRSVAAGLESLGHQVDVLDGDQDQNARLTVYRYVAIGSAGSTLFGGKIPSRVAEFLSSAGTIGGKPCFAFTPNRPIGALKVLRSLMAAMEREGMFVRYSEVLRSPEEAQLVAKRLKLDH